MTTPTADRSVRSAVGAVLGLMLAIVAIGIVGVLINGNIHGTVERAIDFDVELEDRGDDLRVSILEVRHYHRDMLLNNPDPTRVNLWRFRFDEMIAQIEALQDLLAAQPPDRQVPQTDELRSIATDYYDSFAAAVRDDIGNAAEFRNVAEDLLVPLDRMERIAQLIDQEGELRAATAFQAIDQASTNGTIVLIGVIAGLSLLGAFLARAVVRLVGDQRRLVVAEQAAAAQQAAVAQAKSDFIADASHELRTPLTVLRGNAEIGLSLAGDCGHGEILQEILNESERMSRLVDDLLFLARSDRSSVPLDLRPVDIGRAAREVAARAEVLARERGATLVTDLRATGTARADANRIDQALLILVDNAAKYGPADGTVELATALDGERIVIEVRDRGPGIPLEEATRIFERFYRVESADRHRVRGAGLGLPIAAAIVEGHGGEIAAIPREGGGTIMRVTLPLR